MKSNYNFFHYFLDTTREEYRKKKGRKVKSIESALEVNNYDQVKIPSAVKKYTVKVKAEIRPEQKIDWINRPQQAPGRPAGRPKKQDIITNKPGPATAAAKNADTPIKAWELFFDNHLIQTMVTETNKAIQETRASMPAAILNSDKKCHFKDTNEIQIRGLIGMLYFRGILNQSLESIDHLFDDEIGESNFSFAISPLDDSLCVFCQNSSPCRGFQWAKNKHRIFLDTH